MNRKVALYAYSVFLKGGFTTKAKNLLFLGVALLISVLLSGCSTFEMDTEQLMQPPRLNEEQSKLNAALTEVAGENIQLRYITEDENTSAFVFEDLDGDGNDEVLAFYSADNDSTRINILKQIGEQWTSVYEAAGSSGEIESIHFIDCEKSRKALLVKWAQDIGVYNFTDNKLEAVYSSACDGLEYADMDSDGLEDVIIFYGSYSGHSKANIIYHKDGILVASRACDLNSSYSGIYSKIFGNMGNGKIGLFTDSKIYDNIYLTEVVSLDDDNTIRSTIATFIKLSEDEKINLSESGYIYISGYGKRGIYIRNTAAVCTDIDNDGIIEFPVENRDDIASTEDDRLFYIDYMKYDGEDSVSVLHGFYSDSDGCFIELSEKWDNNISIQRSAEEEGYSFIENSTGEPVLTISRFSSENAPDRFDERYVLLGKSNSYSYYATVTASEKSAYYIEPSEIKNLFRFIV